jgi:hypothetical protein
MSDRIFESEQRADAILQSLVPQMVVDDVLRSMFFNTATAAFGVTVSV